jgi:hypothetical protein
MLSLCNQTFRSVFVEDGKDKIDIIRFYNEVYLKKMQTALVSVTRRANDANGVPKINISDVPPPTSQASSSSQGSDEAASVVVAQSPLPKLRDVHSPRRISQKHNIMVSPRKPPVLNLMSATPASAFRGLMPHANPNQSPAFFGQSPNKPKLYVFGESPMRVSILSSFFNDVEFLFFSRS